MDLLEKASIILTPTAYNNGEALCVKPTDGSGDFDFSRNSAATRVNAQGLVENVQILSSNLVQNGDFSEEGAEEVSNGSFSQEGAEEIVNGSFDTDTNWTKGTGWSISGGSANCDGTQNANSTLVQQGGIKGATINFVVGKTYKVNFDIVVTSGRISNIEVASSYDSNSITTSGNHTTYITAVSTNNRFTITANPDFIGSIDNVSVKEVGQDWTFGTGWSVGENKATIDNTVNASLDQTCLTSGKIYKVSFEISDLQVGGNITVGDIVTPSAYTATSNGLHTFYYTATNSTLRSRGKGYPCSVTNISVKEVGQNWDLGTGWSIGEDKAISDATQGYIVQTDVGGAGVTATYKVQWTQNITAGTRLRFFARNYNDGGNATIISITRDDGLVIGGGNCIGNGTFTAYVSSTNGYSFKLLAEAGVEGDISNVTTIQITDDTNLPRINYEGFSYQDALGSELVVNGGFDSDSNWYSDANWSIANGVATSTGSGRMFQSIPFLENNIGTKVKVSFDIVDYTSAGVVINCYGGVSSLFQGVGSYSFITTTTNSLNLYINNAGQGNLVGSIDNVSVKEYLGQEVVPDSGCGSWLFEPQSTNLIPNANQYAGNTVYYTVTSNQSSPDGENNATLFVEKTSTSPYTVNSINASVVGGQTYSYSFFVKYAGKQNIPVNATDGVSGFLANIDILNGTVNSGTAEIKDFGNGWYRVSMTRAVAASATNASIQFNFGTQTGDGTSGFYLFGYQVEQQSYATSYIPTEGTSVTRNQDVCNNGGSLASINSTEGVLYAEIAALTDSGSNRSISISDGTNTNQIVLRFSNSANQITAYITDGGSITASLNNTLSNALNYNKIALKYKLNDVALWVNGVEVATDTNATMPSGFDVLKFSRADGANNFFAKTKALVVYKEALSDEELIELTTI